MFDFMLSAAPVTLVFVVFLFVVILPPRRAAARLRKRVLALHGGDRVLLKDGFFGTVITRNRETLNIKIDDGPCLSVQVSAVEKVVSGAGSVA
ncbi:preprotein translocase subunit YajC [Thalassospira xiamenensis]|uniref:Preprotein translocase, YajC subunit n=1 Tax=Thalassospira xiamenensis TaxID=220697 RepID=A0A285TSG5_9PROT|nr:preprotein translocase subunit YajC [Thalassospira xiamenensis]SOC26591.1 preprotein translocase, YajC subunit [Thalassospira xiamenensis]